MMIVASAADRQVAVVIEPKSMPVSIAEHLARKHRRLHDDDVCHGKKCRHPGEQFRADRGFIFRQVKKSVEHDSE